jgi:hypothetical protein
MSIEFLRGVNGLPFYMAHTAPTEDSSAIAFERNFNPMLKHDSTYFGKLNEVISCVESNASKSEDEQKTACQKEFKAMRLTAFKNELLYHNVNKRFYMDLIQYKRHESPY